MSVVSCMFSWKVLSIQVTRDTPKKTHVHPFVGYHLLHPYIPPYIIHSLAIIITYFWTLFPSTLTSLFPHYTPILCSPWGIMDGKNAFFPSMIPNHHPCLKICSFKQLNAFFCNESFELCGCVKLQSLSFNNSLAQATTSGSDSPFVSFSMTWSAMVASSSLLNLQVSLCFSSMICLFDLPRNCRTKVQLQLARLQNNQTSQKHLCGCQTSDVAWQQKIWFEPMISSKEIKIQPTWFHQCLSKKYHWKSKKSRSLN